MPVRVDSERAGQYTNYTSVDTDYTEVIPMPTPELIRSRVERAAQEPPRLYEVAGEPGVYVAVSESRMGAAYLLRVEGRGVACSCPDFAHREYCKHAAGLAIRLDMLPPSHAPEPDPRERAPLLPDPSRKGRAALFA
jgi:hypothetical protein